MGAPLRVLITGSNKGIGLGLCAAYAERGDHVIAACRTPSPELERLEVEIVDRIDVTDSAAVTRLSSAASAGIDVLIGNAGINTDSTGLADMEVARLAEMYDVNTLGCVRVVLAVLPHLRGGGKIALMSSMGLVPVGVLGARTVGNYGYRMSKSALISFGQALAHDVRDRGIAVALTSPGRVDTPMLRQVLAEGRAIPNILDECVDILTAGRQLRDRIDRLTVEHSPALDRDPDGNPAIPSDVLARLQEANETQFAQAGQMASDAAR